MSQSAPLSSAFPDKIIVAIRSNALPHYALALKGARKCLKEKAGSTQVEDFVLPDSPDQLEDFFNMVRTRKPSAIIAFGSTAARLSKETVKDFPTVFCMVRDPESVGLMSAGVSLDISVADQIGFIARKFPQFKRIGAIVKNDKDLDALQEIQRSGKVALVIATVDSPRDLDKTIRSLSEKKVDCLLMPSDPDLCNPQIVPQVLLQTLYLNIPTLWTAAPLVKAGGLAALYADVEANGCAAGVLAARILGGESAGDLPIVHPTQMKSAVNVIVAERMGIQLNKDVIQNADEVIR